MYLSNNKKIEEKILTELREILISVNRIWFFMFKFDLVSMEKFVPVKGENQGSPHGNQDFSKLSQYFSFNCLLLERYVSPLSNKPLTSIIGSLISAPHAIELVDPPLRGVFQYPCSYLFNYYDI